MNASSLKVLTLIVGPPEHGVVRHAADVAAHAGLDVARSLSPDDVDLRMVDDCSVVLLHYTDRLFGDDATTAARRFSVLVARIPGRIVVSMHDIPFADSSAHSTRRRAAYAAVCAAADGLIVASNTERERLSACLTASEERFIDVVRLPMQFDATSFGTAVPTSPSQWTPTPTTRSAAVTIGVIGFVYPGKGHQDVIEAASSLPYVSEVLALGGASPDHAAMPAQLAAEARRRDQHFASTGHLDDASLIGSARQVSVGVVPARRPSASASLNSWIAAGRRPLVARNEYTTEIAELAPDLLNVYDPTEDGALTRALRCAVARPASTWHVGRIPESLSMATTVADLHRVCGRFE